MILLAIDTCDARGSVAVLRDEALLSVISHDSADEYSSWLLPAVRSALERAEVTAKDVDVYAAAAGPGSFTGVRIGLTAVKAWAEVYGKPIAPVSRLEAFAIQSRHATEYVASLVDAQREQVFAALYERDGTRLERVDDEMVIAPEEFISLVSGHANGASVAWVTPDIDRIMQLESLRSRKDLGDIVEKIQLPCAPHIGIIGYRLAAERRTVDALTLDANYVRRPDAETLWKGGSANAR